MLSCAGVVSAVATTIPMGPGPFRISCRAAFSTVSYGLVLAGAGGAGGLLPQRGGLQRVPDPAGFAGLCAALRRHRCIRAPDGGLKTVSAQ